jgi:hypothetical protein
MSYLLLLPLHWAALFMED